MQSSILNVEDQRIPSPQPIVAPFVTQRPPSPSSMAYFNQDHMPLGTIPGGIHDFPRNPDKFCSKFYYLGGRMANEHIEAFKDAVVRNNIEHQDVLYRIFPYSLGKNEYNWYLTLPTNSISGWDVLEKSFIDQF